MKVIKWKVPAKLQQDWLDAIKQQIEAEAKKREEAEKQRQEEAAAKEKADKGGEGPRRRRQDQGRRGRERRAESEKIMTQIPGGSRDAGLIRIRRRTRPRPTSMICCAVKRAFRGQQGITANRRRKWYYRNWFVFMLAGLLGAMAAWAIIEPHFQDMPYYQGKIEKIDTDAIRWPALHHRCEVTAQLRINGETIYLLSFSRRMEAGRVKGPADPGSLTLGQEVGVYLSRNDEVAEQVRDRPALAIFLDPAPPPRSEPMPPLHQVAGRAGGHFAVALPQRRGAVGLCHRRGRRSRLPLAGGACSWPAPSDSSIGLIGGFVSQFLAGLITCRLTTSPGTQSSAGGDFNDAGIPHPR